MGLSKQWASYMNDALYNSFDIYFRNIDTAKFKERCKPETNISNDVMDVRRVYK